MSELEIQENMSAEEAFMDTESAYEEIPEAFPEACPVTRSGSV